MGEKSGFVDELRPIGEKSCFELFHFKNLHGAISVKKKDLILKEFARSLSDDDLKWLSARLSQRLGGDLGDAMEALQTNAEMDRLLLGAKDADAFYDLADETAEYLERDLRRRSHALSD